jgi:hypothetical protein
MYVFWLEPPSDEKKIKQTNPMVESFLWLKENETKTPM